jgi:hypothetical protein
MVVTFGPMRPGPSCLRGHRGRIHGYHADVPAANRRRPAFIYVLPRHRQSNTEDKLRASDMLNARQLHPLVRRPRGSTGRRGRCLAETALMIVRPRSGPKDFG